MVESVGLYVSLVGKHMTDIRMPTTSVTCFFLYPDGGFSDWERDAEDNNGPTEMEVKVRLKTSIITGSITFDRIAGGRIKEIKMG
jgi:hypothetical protein